MERIEVGILGATGTVGQQFLRLLTDHPWFKPAWLAASERSEGRVYREAATWRLPTIPPPETGHLRVEPCTPGRGPRLVFSALDAAAADAIEPAFAAAGHIVVSNTKTFRMHPDVPLLIPEINPDHLELVTRQRHDRGWIGAIVTNPNCATVVIAMALAPLRQFGLQSALVTTLQAVSGAGYPGVASLDILGNVIPAIGGEEEKVESEPQKILGALSGGAVVPHPVVVSAHTTRVPVVDGHTAMMSVSLQSRPSIDDVRHALETFRGRPQELMLPSAPPAPIVYHPSWDRPQPRFDAERDGGMTITIGRLRPCRMLGMKMVALGHNTVRGAAGAAVLNAELMMKDGWLD